MSEHSVWSTEVMSEADYKSLVTHLENSPEAPIYLGLGHAVFGRLRVGYSGGEALALQTYLTGWAPHAAVVITIIEDMHAVGVYRWHDDDLVRIGRMDIPRWVRTGTNENHH